MRDLVVDALRLTERAAVAASGYVGRGNKDAADQAAVDAMRGTFEDVPVRGTVVIGEGEKDEAPMLYIGESVGSGQGPSVDVAVDPLEGTTLTARGDNRALSVLAMTPEGGFLNAPDVYMMKLAAGPSARGALDLDRDFSDNLERLAEARGKSPDDLFCVMLDRDRNLEFIEAAREVGCRIRLIDHGDISAALAACLPGTGVDLLAGIGSSTEGVLSAAAIRALGGEFLGRLNPLGEDQHRRVEAMGIHDLERVYDRDDLSAHEDVLFAATGVTDGNFVRGVRREEEVVITESLVITAPGGARRTVRSRHPTERMPFVSGGGAAAGTI